MALNDPLWLDAASYSAREDREALALIVTEGLISGGAVTPRAAGANMSVDVAELVAAIAGDEVPDQGVYVVRSDADENVTVAAADPNDARTDLLVARVRDASGADPGAANDWVLEVIAGTPGGAAATLPDTALQLGTITVPAGAVAIDAGNIDTTGVTQARHPLSVTPAHDQLPGLGDDDHPHYLTAGRHGAITHDHGQLGGRGDDDHQQYLNDARHAAVNHYALLDTIRHSTGLSNSNKTAVDGAPTFITAVTMPIPSAWQAAVVQFNGFMNLVGGAPRASAFVDVKATESGIGSGNVTGGDRNFGPLNIAGRLGVMLAGAADWSRADPLTNRFDVELSASAVPDDPDGPNTTVSVQGYLLTATAFRTA